jgi:hypothetical protein
MYGISMTRVWSTASLSRQWMAAQWSQILHLISWGSSNATAQILPNKRSKTTIRDEIMKTPANNLQLKIIELGTRGYVLSWEPMMAS